MTVSRKCGPPTFGDDITACYLKHVNLVSESSCEVPRDQHVSSLGYYFKGDMKLGARRSYTCESGYENMAEEATCTRDGWTPKPLCAGMFCS